MVRDHGVGLPVRRKWCMTDFISHDGTFKKLLYHDAQWKVWNHRLCPEQSQGKEPTGKKPLVGRTVTCCRRSLQTMYDEVWTSIQPYTSIQRQQNSSCQILWCWEKELYSDSRGCRWWEETKACSYLQRRANSKRPCCFRLCMSVIPQKRMDRCTW